MADHGFYIEGKHKFRFERHKFFGVPVASAFYSANTVNDLDSDNPDTVNSGTGVIGFSRIKTHDEWSDLTGSGSRRRHCYKIDDAPLTINPDLYWNLTFAMGFFVNSFSSGDVFDKIIHRLRFTNILNDYDPSLLTWNNMAANLDLGDSVIYRKEYDLTDIYRARVSTTGLFETWPDDDFWEGFSFKPGNLNDTQIFGVMVDTKLTVSPVPSTFDEVTVNVEQSRSVEISSDSNGNVRGLVQI